MRLDEDRHIGIPNTCHGSSRKRLKSLVLRLSGGSSARRTGRLEGRKECKTEERSLGEQGKRSGVRLADGAWWDWLCSAQNRTEGHAQAGEVGGFGFGGPKRDLALSVAVTRVAPTACPRQLVGDSALGQQHRCASD